MNTANRPARGAKRPRTARQKSPTPIAFVSGMSTVKSKVVWSDNDLIDAHVEEQIKEAMAAGFFADDLQPQPDTNHEVSQRLSEPTLEGKAGLGARQ